MRVENSGLSKMAFLSRMLYGGRYSLVIGLGATAFALVIGSIIGSLAAAAARK